MNKRVKRERNLSELKRLASESGLVVEEYAGGTHCRIFGGIVTDYWPGTDRAWVTGSTSKAIRMTVPAVIASCLGITTDQVFELESVT